MTRRTERGFTLVEILITMTISLFMVSMAILFMTQETKLLTRGRGELDAERSARSGVALLARDLRRAGTGFGYGQTSVGDPYFLGLRTGAFRAGGFSFSDGELMVAFTDGEIATVAHIADQTANAVVGLSCVDLVRAHQTGSAVLTDMMGRQRALVSIPSQAPVLSTTPCSCPGSLCFPFELEPMMDLAGNGVTRPWGKGEILPNPTKAVWFLSDSSEANGFRDLRRYHGPYSAVGGCDGGRASCGIVVSFEIEAFHFRVHEFEPLTQRWQEVTWIPIPSVTGAWGDFTGGLAPASRNALRVDIEVIARTEQEVSGATPVVRSGLSDNVYPASGDDGYYRTALRSSVRVYH